MSWSLTAAADVPISYVFCHPCPGAARHAPAGWSCRAGAVLPQDARARTRSISRPVVSCASASHRYLDRRQGCRPSLAPFSPMRCCSRNPKACAATAWSWVSVGTSAKRDLDHHYRCTGYLRFKGDVLQSRTERVLSLRPPNRIQAVDPPFTFALSSNHPNVVHSLYKTL